MSAVSTARRKHRTEPLRIVVLGYLVRGPLGGLAWHHLQYAIGFAELGHDVYFIEDSDDYPSCYHPTTNATDVNATYGLRFARRAFRELNLDDRWAYFDAHRSQWEGPCAFHAEKLCSEADVIVNISGMNPIRSWCANAAVRVLIDTDPVFTQIRHLTDPAAVQRAKQHTAFFSFGANLAHDSSSIPDDGFPWAPTRQPVALDKWKVTKGPVTGPFTTVMQWRSYPAVTHKGRHFGLKSDSFGPFLDLPAKVGARFALAVGGRPPTELLRLHGWAPIDPRRCTRDPWTYQRFVRQSKAEFAIAKDAYVVTRSGWFSERTGSYLASGRPAVVQDTGFSAWLPSGEGLLSFQTPEQAVAAIEDVNCRYRQHCSAARELAEEYFDGRTVLSELLDTAGSSSGTLHAVPSAGRSGP